MKIIQVDKVLLFPEDIKKLENYGEFISYQDVPSEEEGIKRIRDADIVIDNWFDMPAKVIASAPRLKMIVVAAIGYEWVDLVEAKKRGIIVCNSPGYSADSVAEHTIGLLLDTIRKSFLSQTELRKNVFEPTKYVGKELKGKTLGIIGHGNIGKRVGEIAKNGFNMKIKFANSTTSRLDFEKLLRQSDVISINAPLNKKTKGMLGKKEFELMKDDVIIVNTGRGAIINEDIFIENIKSGKIYAAGLDVLTVEPMNPKSPLFSFSNVVITPHIAFNTKEATIRLSKLIVENIINFIKGHPTNIVS